MNIDRLSIKKFCGISEGELVLTRPVTIVTGANNQGKSSIRDALEYVLCGTHPEIPKKKDVPLELARGKGMKVVGHYSDGFELTRTPSSCSASASELRARFGPDEVLRAVLSAWRFVELSPQERSKLVRGISGGGEQVQAAATAALKETGIDPAAVEILAAEAMKNVEKAETIAVERRRALKRDLGELPEEKPPTVVEIDDEEIDKLDEVNVEALEGKKQQLADQRDRLRERIGAAKLDHQPEKIRARIKEIGDQLFQAPEDRERESTLRKALKKAREDVEFEQKAVAAAHQAKVTAQEEYSALEKLGHTCPTCSQEIAPPLTKKLLSAAMERGNTAAKQLEEAEHRQETVKGAVTELETTLAEIEAKHKEIAGLKVEEASLRKELSDCVSDEDLAKMEEEAQTLEKRIAKGEKIIGAKRDYDTAVAQYAKRGDIEKLIEAWDAAAKVLGKDGQVRKEAASGFDIGRVRQHALQLLPGYTIDVDPDWQIEVNGRHRVSKSEKWRLGCCFAAALSKAAGLGLLVIDEADILQGEARADLLDWLSLVADEFERVIVFATRPEPPAPSADDWLSFWHIDGGHLFPVVAEQQVAV